MNFVDFIFLHLEYPFMALFLLLIPLLAYFILKDFISFKDESLEEKNKRKKLKLFLLFSRILIFILLILALASPFKEVTKDVQGTPKVKLLIDNSSSMQVFPHAAVEQLQKNLEAQIPVETVFIGKKESSRLGDDLLANIRRDDNILLISDGRVSEGTTLGDATLYASTLNATINGLTLEADKHDAAVEIFGPEKVIAYSENTFIVHISKTLKKPSTLIITVDGKEVYHELTDKEEISFKQQFLEGYHKITATLGEKDYFSYNNIYYKTVKVVPKPKVLFISQKESPLQTLYSPVYELTSMNTFPKDLTPYSAIILNDLPGSFLNPITEQLTTFALEGNGLFFVGGENSYDLGNYKGSRIEQILPVSIAQAGKKKGDISVVLLIDISGSTGSSFGEDKAVDVEKALAIGVLKDLSLIHKVGTVAFNTQAYSVGEIKPLLEQPDLEESIARLQDNGGTYIGVGILKAVEMLQNQKGSKNIILISDGKTQNLEEAEDAASFASSQGIRIYTVGVGGDTNEYLLEHYADLTGGAYYKPEIKDRLKILFGDSETSGSRRVYPYVFVDPQHFISQGLEPKGTIYGFNTVVPKNSAKLIATTDVGDPLLTVSRFGLGRIAALTTDDGSLYAPELLNKDNSRIYTRSANWAIGDPERKNEKYIQISDSIVGTDIDVLVKDTQEPTLDSLTFVKTDEKLWLAKTIQNQTGFFSLGNALYAVNSLTEYKEIGQDQTLEKTLSRSGGKMFTKDQTNEIIEYVRARSHRFVLVKQSYSWILALLALLLFLIEICTRRIIRNFYK